MTRALSRIQDLMQREASAGIVLMAMALLAMFFANTTLSALYSGVLDTNVMVGFKRCHPVQGQCVLAENRRMKCIQAERTKTAFGDSLTGD